jgi:hypothetical protein
MINPTESMPPKRKKVNDEVIPAPAPESDAVHHRPKRSMRKTFPKVLGALAEDWGLRKAHMKERKSMTRERMKGEAQTMKEIMQSSYMEAQ